MKIKNIKYFNYLNNDVILRLNLIGNGRIYGYKKNYLMDLQSKTIPDYFQFNGNKNTNINNIIKKLTKKDLLKIYDVNNKMKNIMNKVEKLMIPGMNISDIDEYLYKNICNNKIFPSMFGYEDFPKSCSVSVNNIICHSIPYNYKLKEGDIATVDVCAFNGFHTDMAHTYCIGDKILGKDIRLVKTTKDCLYGGISVCRPGAFYNDIGKIVEKIAVENGFQVIKLFRGHGIGKKLHMKPFIPNYNDKNQDIMCIGDMFAIEPLLCSGNGKTMLLDDGFGYITIDGSNSAHFERVVLITENGYEILNDF